MVSREDTRIRTSYPSLVKFALVLSGFSVERSVKDIVFSWSILWATMPDWSTMAIFWLSSADIIMIRLGRTATPAKNRGPRKVIRRKDLFFTRVRYSRAMIILRFLSFMAYF